MHKLCRQTWSVPQSPSTEHSVDGQSSAATAQPQLHGSAQSHQGTHVPSTQSLPAGHPSAHEPPALVSSPCVDADDEPPEPSPLPSPPPVPPHADATTKPTMVARTRSIATIVSTLPGRSGPARPPMGPDARNTPTRALRSEPSTPRARVTRRHRPRLCTDVHVHRDVTSRQVAMPPGRRFRPAPQGTSNPRRRIARVAAVHPSGPRGWRSFAGREGLGGPCAS